MLKEDWKQNLVLLSFCFIQREVLTVSTLIFVALGFILVTINIRPHKYIRNFLALAVFASYWFKYGKIIDPDIGLNFLTSIITLKILEKETVRDRYMIFFGLLLLVSAGALFERTLFYVFYFTICFFVLLTDFYAFLGQKWRVKDILISLLWVLPFTILLFFFIPRLSNPIPFENHAPRPGEIGYSADVNISDIDSLTPGEGPVFQVMVSKELNQKDLYWRGNTLSFTDGWNWRDLQEDRVSKNYLLGLKVGGQEVKQTFRLFSRPDYFFSLDYPSLITFGRTYIELTGPTRTLLQERMEWVQRYDAYSRPDNEITSPGEMKRYLAAPLTKEEKESINRTFPGNSFSEIRTSIQEYLLKEQFVYSLSPGKSATLQEFLQKKIGFCSHYASFVAIVYRVKGIPARLVSGLMGGQYNRFGDYYVVSQNDAHVWVEIFHEGKWQRIDPTEWIAPDRVRLGGEAYVESVKGETFRGPHFFKSLPYLNDFKMWFDQWDFYFYQWLEEMDYYTQEAWLQKLKLKRQWLLSALSLVILAFMLTYIGFLFLVRETRQISEHEILWNLFLKKMKKRGISLSRINLAASEEMIKTSGNSKAQDLWKELVEISFSKRAYSLKDIKRKIRGL